MMKRILFCSILCIFLFSCDSSSDDQQQDQQNQIEAGFFALNIGNTWTYKNYKYNTSTSEYEDTGVVDSISIVGTQEVNGNIYFQFRRNTIGNEESITFCNPNGEYFELLRDSLGFLIDNNGNVKFTHTNFNERTIATDTWGTIYEKLTEGTSEITVEAGTFSTVYSERYAIDSDNNQLPGLDEFHYSRGVGLIYDSSSFVSENIPNVIRKLDSYEVN